ncbi:hypothetical protein QAD02_007432 [Eretmocerus hayati]|uniref:Uncharacterized protein n=1 Tax=Eretmocerus hayati TaxID=131215 RepID=A0ACC2N3L3_9HYME|nr:hypothetical protein QAD02_007432 [Eretmocerus hayati]
MDVAHFMPYEPNVRKNMYYHRRQKQRAWNCKVKDMHQLHEALQTEDAKRSLLILEDIDGLAPTVKFETITVWVENAKGINLPYIIFVDRTFLKLVDGGLIVHIDATFASRMRIHGLRQLLTVMVRAYDKVNIQNQVSEIDV